MRKEGYENDMCLQKNLPKMLVDRYSTDVPLTVNDVQKVVMLKLKAQEKQAAKASVGQNGSKAGQ